MKKQNRALAVLGLGAAAFFLLGRREAKAESSKAPSLKPGDVVDAGTVGSASPDRSYEFQVVVDAMTPGFSGGAMYRGEWRIAGDQQWTVASSIAGDSSFADPTAARNNALQAIAMFDDNQ